MFEDFENTKKQLSQLADILNKFKSEAVQLRLLEILFDARPKIVEAGEAEPATGKPKNTRKKKSAARASAKTSAKLGDKKKPSTIGPAAIVSKLYDEGYFSSPRTINDICGYADTNLARKIKPNEISGKLARMVRNGELSREKNQDKQYEYTRS